MLLGSRSMFLMPVGNITSLALTPRSISRL